jgi:hypothetical protein
MGYRLIHQLFLGETALALLPIFSQVDVGGVKLGDTRISRIPDQHGFAGWLPASARTGENCSDRENGGQPSKLKRLITTAFPCDKPPWPATPRLLSELKNTVVEMRDGQRGQNFEKWDAPRRKSRRRPAARRLEPYPKPKRSRHKLPPITIQAPGPEIDHRDGAQVGQVDL